MKKLDCLGDVCPVPIIKLQNSIKDIRAGKSVMVVTDHSCSLTAIRDFCKNHGFNLESEEVITGVWEITISK